MKKIYIQLMMLAAMVVAGVAMTSCQNEEAVTGKFTMSVKATKGDGNTKALSLDGSTLNATWAEGERVTVHNDTKNADLEGYLEAQNNGAETTFAGTITGTIETGDVLTLKFNENPNYSSQDGTLAYIAAHCDYAVATVTVSGISGGNIKTSGHANFVNQQAIVGFKLKNKAGDASLYMATLKISDGTHTYTVNRRGSADTFYVAFPGFNEKTISMLASYETDIRDYIKSGVSFSNGQYYEITVNMDEVLAMASATSSSVGKVIATDGKLYSHVRTAELAGATASGIVAYVGEAGSVYGNRSDYKAIAISLDYPGGVLTWGGTDHPVSYYSTGTNLATLYSQTGVGAYTSQIGRGPQHETCGGHPAIYAAWNYGTARPSGASMWFMADAGQWNMVVKGLTGSSDDLSTTVNSNLAYDKMNVKVAATGATPIDNFQHWTVSEYNDAKAWEYHQSGYLIEMEKSYQFLVRPIFTF